MTLYWKPSNNSYPSYERPEVCPHCHRVTACEYSAMNSIDSYKGRIDIIRYRCQCNKPITCTYYVPDGYDSTKIVSPMSVFPKVEASVGEASKLEMFSPKFVSIYAEVLKAKQYGLFTLVGPGLRKAIEFLIKDYLLYINAVSEDKLKKLALRKCINEHLNDENLIAVADAAAIVGNDETHWVKDNPEYDVDDMQLFADVAISIMSSRLAIEEAKLLRQQADSFKKQPSKQECNASDQGGQHTDKANPSDH